MQQSLQLYVMSLPLLQAMRVYSWPKFWDHALDKGAAGTSSALALLKLLTLIPYNGIYPIKGCKAIIEDDTAAAHFLSLHTDLTVSLEECLNAVVTCSEDFFCLGLSLHNYFRSCPHLNFLLYVLSIFLPLGHSLCISCHSGHCYYYYYTVRVS